MILSFIEGVILLTILWAVLDTRAELKRIRRADQLPELARANATPWFKGGSK